METVRKESLLTKAYQRKSDWKIILQWKISIENCREKYFFCHFSQSGPHVITFF